MPGKPPPPPPKEKEEIIYEACAPLWMLTMGDTMSLLLTFFVMLLTFSTFDEGKLLKAMGSMKGAFGIMEAGAPSNDAAMQPDEKAENRGEVEGGEREEILVNKENIAAVNLRTLKIANKYNELKERILELGFDKFITIQQFDQGIFMDIEFDKLFISGTAELDHNAAVILQSFANLAGSVGNEVQLTACFNEGESSKGKKYSALWALARERIVAIGELLYSKYHIARSRMSYGYSIIQENTPAYLRLLLAEKIGTRETTMAELIKVNQGE